MEKQIILRHVSPEIDGVEVVSGQIVDGQFVPAADLSADLLELGCVDDLMDYLTQSAICPNRYFAVSDNVTDFILNITELPSITKISLYPNFIVFHYVS